MAARENQGYLIAVIILVLLSLFLALGTFLGWSKVNEYADNKLAAEQSLALEKKLNQANGIKAEILKSMIGEMGGGAVAEITTQIESLDRLAASGELDATQKGQVQAIAKDVADFKLIYDKVMESNSGAGEGEQPEELTYKTLINNLSTVLAKQYNEFNVKDRQATLAEQDAARKIAEMQAEVDQVKLMLATREEDLAKEKQQSAEKQKELTAALEQSSQGLLESNTRYDTLKLELAGTIDQQTSQIGVFETENVRIKGKINVYEREVFDKPDGKIVKVVPALNSVFIDLGRVDGLTENRSFAVYDQAVTKFEKDQNIKGTLEIIRVMDNQAEARVTHENPTDPILPGDWVLTATWDPGHAVPIALAGFFDLDSDGSSDLDKLMQMIKRNGGDVVAWHDDEGNITGEINSSVRFLVLGEAPSLGPDANPAVVRAMVTMEAQAEANTVQVIDLQKLLNRMGVRGKPKVEKLDNRVLTPEFQERSPNSSLRSDVK